MKVFGLKISWSRAKALTASTVGGAWYSIVREVFAGAWQSVVHPDSHRSVLAFSAVFSCVTIIASDVSKLRACLNQRDTKTGVCTPVPPQSAYWQVLVKPNRYQTWLKFIEQWIVAKLLWGNVYVLKQRDGRGIVTALYVLDSQRVTPLVAPDGGVYYQLSSDHLSGLTDAVTVPAREIIHDMMVSLWHPLVGVSPIFACAMSATMGNKIQENSTRFFKNMSTPSGMLTAPSTISDETAARLKREWEDKHAGENVGRIAIGGDGIEYKPMTIPAVDAQLIEQLRWSVEDVARAFHVPLYKVGGPIPVGVKMADLDMTYYKDCIQVLIEALEQCLGEGLGLSSPGYEVEFDEDGLLRMDKETRYRIVGEAIKGGWMSPNEGRATENLGPVDGGGSPYLQQQNFSLAALAKRDALPNPFVIDKPAIGAEGDVPGKTTADTNAADQETKALVDKLIARLQAETVETVDG